MTEMAKEALVDHQVRNIRQLSRGFEAEVTLGVGSVPSASLTVKVTLGPLDEELAALRRQLSELFVRRASEHLEGVIAYNRERDKRLAKVAEKKALAEKKTA